MNKRLPLVPLFALLALPTLAHAHTGVGATHGFSHGFAHPLTGLDHLCAMIAVGLWAAQLGASEIHRRSLWAIPLTFVGVMGIGGALGAAGVSLPFVEHGIVLSVLVLGVLIAAAVRLPLWAGAGIVGLFALFHGHAHGAEMPESAAGLAYGIGFLIATAMLHAIGIGVGIAVQKIGSSQIVRFAGAAVVACGLYLICFPA